MVRILIPKKEEEEELQGMTVFATFDSMKSIEERNNAFEQFKQEYGFVECMDFCVPIESMVEGVLVLTSLDMTLYDLFKETPIIKNNVILFKTDMTYLNVHSNNICELIYSKSNGIVIIKTNSNTFIIIYNDANASIGSF